MRSNYWLNEYYRNYLPYYCPYCQPGSENFEGRSQREFGYDYMDDYYEECETPEDAMVRYPIYGGAAFRNNNEIESISKTVYGEISKNLKFIESMPITKELMHYVIRVIGDYINENHAKFLGPIEMKVEGLMKALRKDLYWVFEVLELFGVEHETVISFVENVVSAFLRAIIEENHQEQTSPMRGVK